MFDFLVSADLLVDDFGAAVTGLRQRLGFTGRDALAPARAQTLGVPFLFVEERA